MTVSLVLPVLAALVAGLAAGPIQRRLPPALAAKTLLTTALGCATSVLWGFALVALASVAQVPWLASIAGWCHHVLPEGDQLPPVLGGAVLVGVAYAGWRVTSVHRAYRRACRVSDGDPLQIVQSAAPLAYAVPGRSGRHGHVVISTGLSERLPPDELAVVLAHERAHLELRHHRYVHAGELSAAAIPLLRPLARQLRYATERWADEHAAEVVGDRQIVARSIARAALMDTGSANAPALAAVGSDVTSRVEALLREPISRVGLTYPLVVAALTGMVTVLLASTVQLHHLVEVARQVCPV